MTLVIYFDAKEWDDPAAIAEEDFGKFHTSLKEVLAFIKYSRDMDKMENLLVSEPAYRHLGRKEVDVLNSCAHANLVMQKNEEVLDVCEAFQMYAQRAADQAAKEAAKEATREATVKTFIETCREFGASLADTTGRFAKKFSVSEQDAAALVKKYW